MGFGGGGGGGGGGGVFVSSINPIMLHLTQLRQCGDCHEHETESRVQRLHEYHGSSGSGSARRNPEARERIPQASRAESTKARAEAEDQTFRFPRPCRRLECRRRAVLTSQVIVGQSLAGDLRYYRVESLVHVLPVVVAKSLFVDIAEQVKRLDADIGSVQAALQETPEVLDCVCVYIAADVFDRMIDYRVIVIVGQSFIRKQFVAENRGTGFDVFADRFLKFLPAALINMHRTDLPVSLYHAKDDRFVGSAGAVNLFRSLVLVHVARLAADEGLINFYFAAQLAAPTTLHCEPNAVEHEPCGFLSNTDGAVNLPRANPVLTICDHPDSRKPLIQPERRVLENSSDLDAELRFWVPSLALPKAARRNKTHVFGAASRTNDALPPAACNQIIQAVVGIGEIDNCFSKSGGFLCHE